MDRRRWIGLTLGAAAAVTLPRGVALGSMGLASRIRIAPASEPGERLVVTGRVVGEDGTPRGGIEIDAYHTDATGLYRPDRFVPHWPDRPPRLEGRLATAADGSYEIDTIRPGPYPGGGNPAHIHFHVGAARQPETLWFEGDPFLTAEQIRREEALAEGTFRAIQPLAKGADGVLRCRRDFRLRGAVTR